MKHLLVLGLAVFMFSCGSGGKGDGKDSTGGDQADHSEQFELLKISSNGTPFGSELGMKIDQIKKNHSETPDDISDSEYLSYSKVIGPDDIYDELEVTYSFDSDNGEMYYYSVDVTSSKLSDGPDLYKELVAYYDGKFGKGSTEADDEWDNMHYVTNLNNKKTEITVENQKKNPDYSWVIITVEELY